MIAMPKKALKANPAKPEQIAALAAVTALRNAGITVNIVKRVYEEPDERGLIEVLYLERHDEGPMTAWLTEDGEYVSNAEGW